MTDLPKPQQEMKIIYTSPKLVRYGDVRCLTRGGAGSPTEAAAMNMASHNKA
jgi:hypothetical protein